MNLLQRFDQFAHSLHSKDRIALIHDLDPDGISSGVITAHAILLIRRKKIDHIMYQKPGEIPLTEKTIKILKKKKINKIITTDKAIDQNPKTLKAAAAFADLVIFDHHKIYEKKVPQNVLLLKPQLIHSPVDPSRYCTAKLCYDLWSRHVNLTPYAWKACPGIIGDMAYLQWKSFVDNEITKHGYQTTKNPFDMIFGKIAELCSQTECYDYRKVKRVFAILWKAKKPEEVLQSELKKYQKFVQKEIDYYKKNMKKLAEFYPKKELIFYVITPKYNIKSNLSTILSMKEPHKTMILASLDKQKKGYTLSLRRQDQKVKMNDLVEKALSGLQGSGGGHIPAAGGRVAKKDFLKFKERILEMV
ncbi:hypothetical protein J4410_01310 [Candidatus Woesearchaeota archaeon]|nr:hypothetical protein [Candidatus Woesearchaeota archaeon]